MTTTQSSGADIEMHQLPRDLRSGERTIRLRHLASDDGNALLDFGRRQPGEDLLFQERDITNVADIGDWIHETEAGSDSFGGRRGTWPDHRLYATIERGRLRWTRHVAEIRVMVDVERAAGGSGSRVAGTRIRERVERTMWPRSSRR